MVQNPENDWPTIGAPGSAAYQSILARIRAGDVLPQTKLVDTALATEMGVSRMPVREALLRLVHEGYLVGTTRGFMLPQLSPHDIRDIFEVRRLIEPRAAAAASHAMDEFALAALEAAYRNAARAVEAGDPHGLMEANTRFRRSWLAAVPNQRLAGTIARFVDHVQTVRNGTLHDAATQAMVMRVLTELIDGFRRRDALHVQDSMARFMATAEDRFFALTVANSGEGRETA